MEEQKSRENQGCWNWTRGPGGYFSEEVRKPGKTLRLWMVNCVRGCKYWGLGQGGVGVGDSPLAEFLVSYVSANGPG